MRWLAWMFLMLTVTVGLLWAGTSSASAYYFRPPSPIWHFTLTHLRIEVASYDGNISFHAVDPRIPADRVEADYRGEFGPAKAELHLPGINFVERTCRVRILSPGIGWSVVYPPCTQLWISYLYPFIFCFVALVFCGRKLFAQWRRLQRDRAGLCFACGYDLRASPERCPECGTPISAQAEARSLMRHVWFIDAVSLKLLAALLIAFALGNLLFGACAIRTYEETFSYQGLPTWTLFPPWAIGVLCLFASETARRMPRVTTVAGLVLCMLAITLSAAYNVILITLEDVSRESITTRAGLAGAITFVSLVAFILMLRAGRDAWGTRGWGPVIFQSFTPMIPDKN